MFNLLDVVTPGHPHEPIIYEPTNSTAITIVISSIVVVLIALTVVLIIVNRKKK